jgi:DNA repair/transcription protein MET18/MMS19
MCEAIDEEKDPECLKLSFNLVEAVMKLFPDPSGLAAQYASEVFEILSKYYPIYFTHVCRLTVLTFKAFSCALLFY